MKIFAKCAVVATTMLSVAPTFAQQFGEYDPDLAGFAHGQTWSGSLNLIAPNVVLGCAHSAPPIGEKLIFANGETATVAGSISNLYGTDSNSFPNSDFRLFVLDRSLPQAMVMPVWQAAPPFLGSNGALPAGTRFERAGFHRTSDWASVYNTAGWITQFYSDPSTDLYVADVSVGSPAGFSARVYSKTASGDMLGLHNQDAVRGYDSQRCGLAQSHDRRTTTVVSRGLVWRRNRRCVGVRSGARRGRDSGADEQLIAAAPKGTGGGCAS